MKKWIFLIIFLLVLIFSLYYLLSSNLLLLRFTGLFTSVKSEKDIYVALNSLIAGKSSVLIDLENENTCYWIIPGRGENDYFIEIREYGKEFGECVGYPRSSNYIKTNQKINMFSHGCLCQGKYVLELINDGLKISKV
jgi:hypothetical protein